MAKSLILVVQTQLAENYGAHCWDGEGNCPQRWKFKGGDTYVVSDAKDTDKFRDLVSSSIVSANDYYSESILDIKVMAVSDYVESEHVEHWESPIFLRYTGKHGSNAFFARTEKSNDYMEHFTARRSSWVQSDGERRDISFSFLGRNGSWMTNEELSAIGVAMISTLPEVTEGVGNE